MNTLCHDQYIDTDGVIRTGFVTVRVKIALLLAGEVRYVKINCYDFLDQKTFRDVVRMVVGDARDCMWTKRLMVIPLRDSVIVTTYHTWIVRGDCFRHVGDASMKGLYGFSMEVLCSMLKPVSFGAAAGQRNVKVFCTYGGEPSLHFMTFYGTSRSSIIDAVDRFAAVLEPSFPGIRLGCFIAGEPRYGDYTAPTQSTCPAGLEEYLDRATSKFIARTTHEYDGSVAELATRGIYILDTAEELAGRISHR